MPVVGVAAILITLFVKMKTPEGSLKEKLARMDWMYVKRTDVALISCVLTD